MSSIVTFNEAKFWFLERPFRCKVWKGWNLFFLRTPAGLFALRLPSICFFQHYYSRGSGVRGFRLRFLEKFHFRNFFQQFVSKLQVFFYFFKIKVRGLGYRIKKMTNNLFRFFMGTTNYLFFHVPENILVRARRRRMLLVSVNKEKLNLVFSHLILLKQIIPYKLRGIFYPKQIILLKPGKKSF